MSIKSTLGRGGYDCVREHSPTSQQALPLFRAFEMSEQYRQWRFGFRLSVFFPLNVLLVGRFCLITVI